jgi:hypothetical protein
MHGKASENIRVVHVIRVRTPLNPRVSFFPASRGIRSGCSHFLFGFNVNRIKGMYIIGIDTCPPFYWYVGVSRRHD